MARRDKITFESNLMVEYLASENEEIVRNKIIQYVKSAASETGFDNIINKLHMPIVTSSKAGNNTFSVVIFNSIRIHYSNNEVSSYPEKVVFYLLDVYDELFAHCETLEELINSTESFNSFIDNLIFSFSVQEYVDTSLFHLNTKYIKQHKKLYDDCLSLDPTAFFSYDFSEEIYFYLPKYGVVLNTCMSWDIGDNFEKNGIPYSYEEIISHNFLPIARTISTKLYLDKELSALENVLNNLNLKSIFQGRSKENWSFENAETYTVIDATTGENIEFATDITEEALVGRKIKNSIPDSHFIRTINKKFYLNDEKARILYRGNSTEEIYKYLYS